MYLAENIYNQSVKSMAWLLLIAYSKIQEEKNKLQIEFNQRGSRI
jgi:hypothetical protein